VTEEVTYFKSAGLREIEFPGIVKASLQLGKTAKSPQTSNPAPGWRICGDLAHFAQPGKGEPQKLHHSRQHPTVPRQAKNRKKVRSLGGSEPATSEIEGKKVRTTVT
jgi:hypothetical protein